MKEKQYVAPQLQLAGEASEVILGFGGGGGDFFSEFMVPDGEFNPDVNSPTQD